MTAIQVFSGTDSVLLDQAVRAAIKEALGDEPADFALAELNEPDYLVDEQYSIAPLVDAAQTPPMLTDRRVVVGHHLARFSTGDSVESLVAYLENPLDTTHLILVWSRGPALNKRTTGLPKKLNDLLKSLKVTITKTDVGGREADGYIDAQLRASGIDLDRGARRMLGDHLGDDVNRLGGILQSLESTFGTETKLSIDHVKPYLGGAGDVPPWDLTDAIAGGDIPEALRTARRMMHGGERHPLAILATLTTHYQRMASLDGAPVGGEKDAAAFLGAKGSTFPIKKAIQQARRMGPDNVKRAWGLIADADVDLRGATAAEPEQVLEVLIARLARL
ncbi:MAG: DNA polymerase III subunit delta [Actinomycetota bacterium]